MLKQVKFANSIKKGLGQYDLLKLKKQLVGRTLHLIDS